MYDTKTQNIVEQICEAISLLARPISFIGNSPLDALEAFGACKAIITSISITATIVTDIKALTTFGGDQAVCVARNWN
ncbi:hypothetical protein F8M41_022895 [Gigaspora margarita]|uniref:Uncharacterized protein n=1 Tax=Gigaspora margarita TaxID=4874 RepID=A0A8H4AED2_GIGMA|nr:hypothetical protein F8M41_022895 [Gigaspora margarita]